jgi:hypothetical protein
MKAREKRIVFPTKQELIKEILYYFPIRRPRKILFDHLPKCGGSSLNAYLEAHYPERKTYSIDGEKPDVSVEEFLKLPQRSRHGYDLVKGHLAHRLLDYVHPECLKVTVLRDPVDRIVSHYYYAKRTPEHYLYSKIHNSDMTLEDYVTSNLSVELRNWYTGTFAGLKVDDAERRPEESITRALEFVLKRYDIVGFLDNFSLFAETLRKQANLRYKYQDEKVNITQERPSLDNIEQSTINKIEQVNHLDIVLYRKIRDAIG